MKKISLILAIIFIFSLPLDISAENEINGWFFSDYYDPSDREIQGSASLENQKYVITTNGSNVWGSVDSCSVLLQNEKVNFIHEECCKTVINVTVSGIEDAVNMNAAAGLVMRSKDDSESANAMWRVLPDGQTRLTYRSTDGGSTDYKSGPTLSFPAELQLERQGNTVTAYYKKKDKWVAMAGVNCTLGVDMYVGIGAFSSDIKPLKAYFTDFAVKSTDTYIATETMGINTEQYTDDTLLIERFDDGSLINLPNTVTNPLWYNGTKYTTFKKTSTNGFAWLRDRVTGTDFVGDTSWTDYEASVDVTFDPSSNGKNIAELVFRARPSFITGFRGDFYYAVGFRDSQICIMKKYTYWDKGVDNKIAWSAPFEYIDGKTRNIKIKVIDNRIDVYLNDKKIITYIDEYLPNLRGCVGLNYEDSIVWFDNLMVKKVEDINGGDYDNYLASGFGTTNKTWYGNIYMR